MPLYQQKDVYQDFGEPQWTSGGEIRIPTWLVIDGRQLPLPDIVKPREWAMEAIGTLYTQVGAAIVGKLMQEGVVAGDYVQAVGDVPAPPAPEDPAPVEADQGETPAP